MRLAACAAAAGIAVTGTGSALASAFDLSMPGDAALVIDGKRDLGNLGKAVAAVGDMNGDGHADILVGASGDRPANNNSTQPGQAFVVFGNGVASQVDSTSVSAGTAPGVGFALFPANLQPTASRYGWAVADAGDFNGDGIADAAVGRPIKTTNASTGGEVYVAFGVRSNPAGINLDTIDDRNLGVRMVANGVAEIRAGWSVAGVGDVNSDGYDDIAVGVPLYNLGGFGSQGAVYVVFGRDTSGDVGNATDLIDLTALSPTASPATGFTIEGSDVGSMVGTAVSAAGDLNGDGEPDLAIGARDDRAVVIYGKPAGQAFSDISLTNAADGGLGAAGQVISGPSSAAFGDVVAGVGDVNGDGLDDLGIGAASSPSSPGASDVQGRAYVLYGQQLADIPDADLSSGDPGATGFVISGRTGDSKAGAAIAATGDMNGDGVDDLAVGSPVNNQTNSTTGSADVVFGQAGTSDLADVDLGALGPRGFHVDGEADSVSNTGIDDFGASLSGGRDVTGDGRPDLLVGDETADLSGKSNAGRAYVIEGYVTPAISYASGITAQEGSAVAALAPQVTSNGAATFTISPALPAGLALDPSTGVISGTPAAPHSGSHTITMTDRMSARTGPATTAVTISVTAAPPAAAPPAAAPPAAAPPAAAPTAAAPTAAAPSAAPPSAPVEPCAGLSGIAEVTCEANAIRDLAIEKARVARDVRKAVCAKQRKRAPRTRCTASANATYTRAVTVARATATRTIARARCDQKRGTAKRVCTITANATYSRTTRVAAALRARTVARAKCAATLRGAARLRCTRAANARYTRAARTQAAVRTRAIARARCTLKKGAARKVCASKANARYRAAITRAARR